MSKPTAAVKNRYNRKAYDRIELTVKKGEKERLEAFARAQGQSVNGFIGSLIREKMGMNETEGSKESTDGEET